MKKSIIFFAFFFAKSLMAASLIGSYEINRDFNSKGPGDALAVGFPGSPTLINMQFTRENIFAPPIAQVSYKFSQNGQVLTARGPLEIITTKADSAIAQLAISVQGEEGSGCGPKDLRVLYVVFSIALNGEYARGHTFQGIRETTSDSCHSAVKTEKYTYSIDE